MKAFTAAITLMAGLAAALPSLQARDSAVCSGTLYSVPQCCRTNVLNVASLDCDTPASATDSEDFHSSCKGSGQAMCCTIPVAGEGLLCNDAI